MNRQDSLLSELDEIDTIPNVVAANATPKPQVKSPDAAKPGKTSENAEPENSPENLEGGQKAGTHETGESIDITEPGNSSAVPGQEANKVELASPTLPINFSNSSLREKWKKDKKLLRRISTRIEWRFIKEVRRNIDSVVTHWLGEVAGISHDHPMKVIGIVLLITLVLGSGILRQTEAVNIVENYSPVNSLTVGLLNRFEEDYGYEERSVLVSANVADPTSNALSVDNLIQALRYWNEFLLPLTTPGNITLSDICVKIPVVDQFGQKKWTCLVTSLLSLWGHNELLLRSSTNEDVIKAINRPDLKDLMGYEMDLNLILGGIVYNEQGYITYASSLMFFIPLISESRWKVNRAADKWEEWLEKTYKTMENDIDFNFEMNVMGSHILTMSLEESELEMYIVLMWGGLLCAVYSVLVLTDLRAFDPVVSQINLIIYVTFSIGCALITGIGLVSWTGVQWSAEMPLCTFLCLGLGFDDCYLLTFDFNRLPPDLTTKERIQSAMHMAGTSISLTSITDLFAFIIGTGFGLTVNFPVMTNFCLYGAACIFFLWLYMIIMFTAFLGLDARRQAARRWDILCCIGGYSDEDSDEVSEIEFFRRDRTFEADLNWRKKTGSFSYNTYSEFERALGKKRPNWDMFLDGIKEGHEQELGVSRSISVTEESSSEGDDAQEDTKRRGSVTVVDADESSTNSLILRAQDKRYASLDLSPIKPLSGTATSNSTETNETANIAKVAGATSEKNEWLEMTGKQFVDKQRAGEKEGSQQVQSTDLSKTLTLPRKASQIEFERQWSLSEMWVQEESQSILEHNDLARASKRDLYHDLSVSVLTKNSVIVDQPTPNNQNFLCPKPTPMISEENTEWSHSGQTSSFMDSPISKKSNKTMVRRTDPLGWFLGKMVRIMLESSIGPAVVVLVFFIFAAFNFWYIFLQTEQLFSFSMKDNLYRGTAAKEFFDNYEANGRYHYDFPETRASMIIPDLSPYSDIETFDYIRDKVKDIDGISSIYGWVWAFDSYLKLSHNGIDHYNLEILNITHGEYLGMLITWVSTHGLQWASDIVFLEEFGIPYGIKNSRLWVMNRLADSNTMIHRLTELREVCEGDLCYPYAEYYAYGDGLLEVYAVVMGTALAAMAVMFLVVWGALSSFFWACFLTFVVALIAVDFLSTMYLIGCYDDQFKVMAVAMAFGFTVDFNMHLVHRFAHGKSGVNPIDKTVNVVRQIGGATFNGALSTLLVVLPSVIWPAVPMQGRGSLTFFMIIVLGVAHSIFLVPTLLMISGVLKDGIEVNETLRPQARVSSNGHYYRPVWYPVSAESYSPSPSEESLPGFRKAITYPPPKDVSPIVNNRKYLGDSFGHRRISLRNTSSGNLHKKSNIPSVSVPPSISIPEYSQSAVSTMGKPRFWHLAQREIQKEQSLRGEWDLDQRIQSTPTVKIRDYDILESGWQLSLLSDVNQLPESGLMRRASHILKNQPEMTNLKDVEGEGEKRLKSQPEDWSPVSDTPSPVSIPKKPPSEATGDVQGHDTSNVKTNGQNRHEVNSNLLSEQHKLDIDHSEKAKVNKPEVNQSDGKQSSLLTSQIYLTQVDAENDGPSSSTTSPGSKVNKTTSGNSFVNPEKRFIASEAADTLECVPSFHSGNQTGTGIVASAPQFGRNTGNTRRISHRKTCSTGGEAFRNFEKQRYRRLSLDLINSRPKQQRKKHNFPSINDLLIPKTDDVEGQLRKPKVASISTEKQPSTSSRGE